MSDNHEYLRGGSNRDLRIHADVTALMLKGAGYAMAFCLVVWFGIWVFIAIGKMLPEESRETEDPTPYSEMLVTPGTPRA